MKVRIGMVALLGSLLLAFAFAPCSAAQAASPAAAPTTGGFTAPVTGTLNGAPFTGTLDITRFVNQSGVLIAVGALTDSAGNLLGTLQTPVTAATGSCTTLDLTLGPRDLNLVGRMIHVNPGVVTITAQPGNLLSIMLCEVASLLKGGGPLGALADVLNNILIMLDGR
jgi:hypothetical protein